MRILHIGTERSWRGGENQIRLLVEGLKAKYRAENWVSYPQGSSGLECFAQICSTLSLTSSNPVNLNSIRRLSKWIKDNHIHIVNAHSSRAHSLALWVKKFCPAVQLVVHRRVDNVIKDRWSTRRKYLSDQVNHFVAVSHCINQMLLEYGVSQKKITVIHDAVDPKPYENLDRTQCANLWRQKLGIGWTPFLFGSASALSEQKAPDVLLKAIDLLKQKSVQEFHCLIAGEGAMRKALLKQKKNLGLEKEVSFVGFIHQIPELLSGLDCFLLPSRNEGLGSVILESMLAQTPVIGSYVGGITEVISQEKTGLLVPKENPQALANAMLQMMTDQSLRHRTSQEALQLVRSEFSLESMVNRTWDVYCRVLEP